MTDTHIPASAQAAPANPPSEPIAREHVIAMFKLDPRLKDRAMSELTTIIEEKLAALREDCAVKRLCLKNAFGRRWGHDAYWDERQAKAQQERPKDVEIADKALADFIAECRPIMGPDWIGNDHGRLCWASYCGGMPIARHYCQREEGHEGNHADEWPEENWAYDSPRGSWPQGVTNDREWDAKVKAEKTEEAAL